MTHSVRTNTSVLVILLCSPEGWEYAAVLVLVSDPPPTRTPQTYRITIRDTTSCQRNDTGNLKDRPGLFSYRNHYCAKRGLLGGMLTQTPAHVFQIDWALPSHFLPSTPKFRFLIPLVSGRQLID